MMNFIWSHLAVTAVFAVALTYVARFLLEGYRIRSQMHKLVRDSHTMKYDCLADD